MVLGKIHKLSIDRILVLSRIVVLLRHYHNLDRNLEFSPAAVPFDVSGRDDFSSLYKVVSLMLIISFIAVLLFIIGRLLLFI